MVKDWISVVTDVYLRVAGKQASRQAEKVRLGRKGKLGVSEVRIRV